MAYITMLDNSLEISKVRRHGRLLRLCGIVAAGPGTKRQPGAALRSWRDKERFLLQKNRENMSQSTNIIDRLKNMPSSYRANYKKAMAGKSKAAAVKAKCLDCTNWQRVEITNCPCEACPLYLYRPFKKK